MICPECSWNNKEHNAFCSACGTTLRQEVIDDLDPPKRWKVPPQKFSQWGEIFRHLGWFDTQVYDIINKERANEKVLFCFPLGHQKGSIKTIIVGRKKKNKYNSGVIYAFESFLYVHAFYGFRNNKSKQYTFYYEDIRTVDYRANSIYLTMQDNNRLELVLDLPRPGLFTFLGIIGLHGKIHAQHYFAKRERARFKESNEFMQVICQFFVELVALRQ